MLSSKRESIASASYSIGDRRISAVTTVDDLGITFNKQLLFERLISKKVNKINFLSGMIRGSLYLDRYVYLDKEIFRSLFASIVKPHFEYEATVRFDSKKIRKVLLKTCNVEHRS